MSDPFPPPPPPAPASGIPLPGAPAPPGAASPPVPWVNERSPWEAAADPSSWRGATGTTAPRVAARSAPSELRTRSGFAFTVANYDSTSALSMAPAAGVWARALAALIDAAATIAMQLFLAMNVVPYLFGLDSTAFVRRTWIDLFGIPLPLALRPAPAEMRLAQLVVVFAPLLVRVGSTAYGATIGKYILGMRVIDVDSGEPIGFLRAFVRETVGQLVISILYVGYIFMAMDDLRRGWHDRLAHSRVVWARR